jgi:hypothetical protein
VSQVFLLIERLEAADRSSGSLPVGMILTRCVGTKSVIEEINKMCYCRQRIIHKLNLLNVQTDQIILYPICLSFGFTLPHRFRAAPQRSTALPL